MYSALSQLKCSFEESKVNSLTYIRAGIWRREIAWNSRKFFYIEGTILK